MVVRYYFPNGRPCLGPPYTKAETADMHRRLSGGPRVVVNPPNRLAALSGSTNHHKPDTSRPAAQDGVAGRFAIGGIRRNPNERICLCRLPARMGCR
jgi:hypothetical protein